MLEYCDWGCLRDALDGGAFFADGSLNYAAILDTAADVAKAMLHLHCNQVRESRRMFTRQYTKTFRRILPCSPGHCLSSLLRGCFALWHMLSACFYVGSASTLGRAPFPSPLCTAHCIAAKLIPALPSPPVALAVHPPNPLLTTRLCTLTSRFATYCSRATAAASAAASPRWAVCGLH